MQNNYFIEKILKLHFWSSNLFSIVSTRNKNFKFKNGEFVMIGIKTKNERFIFRAYSIVNSNCENFLEFLSVIVKNGEFTNLLKNIKIGEELYILKKTTGTLIFENLLENLNNLILISTGTGLAPFISIIKNIFLYKSSKNIFFFHSSNFKKNLSYRYYINNIFFNFLFEKKTLNFSYYPIITKEKFLNNKRITYLLKNRSIFLIKNNFNIFNLEKKVKIMICGNIEMIKDIKFIIENKYKLFEKKNNNLGNYISEKAFLN